MLSVACYTNPFLGRKFLFLENVDGKKKRKRKEKHFKSKNRLKKLFDNLSRAIGLMACVMSNKY